MSERVANPGRSLALGIGLSLATARFIWFVWRAASLAGPDPANPASTPSSIPARIDASPDPESPPTAPAVNPDTTVTWEAAGGPLAKGALTHLVPSTRIELLVSKFANFADLNGYLTGLAALPGVANLRVRRVHRGVLFLSVDYDGLVPLTARLPDVRGYAPARISTDGDLIQVALHPE